MAQVRLSVRVPKDLYKNLREDAKKRGLTLSDYVRIILSAITFPKEEVWKIKIWKIFGVNLVRIERAITKSSSVAEFFSFLDLWSTKVSISPNVSDMHSFDFTIGEKVYNVEVERGCSLLGDIRKIVNGLDRKILESFEEEL